MKSFLTLLILLFTTSAAAASIKVVPGKVQDGGVLLVQVDVPQVAFAVARWNEQPVYLDLTDEAARTLLPVPLGLAPGSYPLRVVTVDRQGRTRRFSTWVQVEPSRRPVERLTLPKAMVSPTKPAVLKRIRQERERLSVIYRQERPGLFWDELQRPVDDPVGSLFGLQRILNGKPRSPHSGVDFRSPRGTPVLAPSVGHVVLVDDLYYTGKTVILDHGGRLISIFAHLEKTDVQTGQQVSIGALLGRVGSTGRSTGPHLHWSVRLHGERVDPLALLALWSRERP